MSMSIVANAPRQIVAPHQTQFGSREYNASAVNPNTGDDGNMNGVILPSEAVLMNSSAFGSQTSPNYQNFQFQPLEPVAKLVFDKYVGPTPESNWVVPGKLLVGAYPASADDAETLDLITSILRNGATKFVCLQQEYREHGVTEAMWRSGQALRPYFEDVRAIVRKKHLIPCLAGHDVVSEQKLCFTHFPIRDCSVTDDDRVLELAVSLVRCIAEGHTIYLHCWGGHGRTGTLVCIMLHLMYGMNDKEAFKYCQAVHDLRQCPVVVGSPQTQTQRDQVSRVIHSCMTLNRLQKSQPAVAVEEPPSLPSPVARNGETLESKLGSPRSATKLPIAAASYHSTPGSAQQPAQSQGEPNSSQGVAQCLTMPPVATPAATAATTSTTDTAAAAAAAAAAAVAAQSQQTVVEKRPEDTGSDEDAEADAYVGIDVGEADADRNSDAVEGRMRLGTMDESDMHEEEGAGVPLEALSAEGGRLSLEEGEIMAGEYDTGMGVEAEEDKAEDEVRGVDAVAGLTVTGTAIPPNEPPVVAKPSFRPLWGGRNLAI